MAFGGSFKEDHPYATGLLIVVVAAFGIAGSVTGQLAAMLAALWVPDALEVNQASSGGGASGSSPPYGVTNPNYNPNAPSGSSQASLNQGGPPPNQANVQVTGSVAAA